MLFRFLNWTRQNPIKARISLLVVGIHFIFFWKIQSSPDPIKHAPMKKISVRYLEEPKIQTPTITTTTTTPIVKSIPKKPIAPLVQEKVVEKKAPEKKLAETKKQTAPAQKKPAAKKAKPVEETSASVKIPDHLLKELEESLQNVEKKSAFKSKKKSLSLPNQITHLEIDQKKQWEVEEEQNDYGHYLISHLQNHLQLPEHGEVKIALTLKRDGTVIKIQVLKAASEKNRVFLEQHLPKMVFPHFPFDKQENTFTLTFCNQ